MILRRTPPRILALVSLAALAACLNDEATPSPREEIHKSDQPKTVFERPPVVPRVDQVKIDDFAVRLEQKYRREASRNPIDLHFTTAERGHLKVRVTYDRKSDPTLAHSIADAAVAHVRRLKQEDSEMRDVTLTIDREVAPYAEE